MAQSDGVYVFDSAARNNNGISDIAAIAALNGGGFNGMNNPFWMMFMWPLMYPFMNMFGGFGNGFGNNGGAGFLANQLNNDVGRDLIMQGINGRADALGQLAQMTNSSVENVRNALAIVNSKLSEVGGQVGMTGLQVVNAIQAGNANLAQQLCQCCCENRLAIVEQTNALQSQAAANAADIRLQLAQNEASDQLSVCQQTNTLSTQAERNTNSIVNAIANQSTMITKEFCDLKERELQNKIDSLVADNALLRSNIANNMQTQQFAAMLAPINAELAAIKAAQPATITLPNSQYSVVPTWAANIGSDFVASYWANRLSAATTPTTTPTTPTTPTT